MKIGTALAALALAGVLAASALSAPAAKKGALVKLHTTGLGKVLVDGRGRTLYLFEADKGKRSVCYGKCAVAWPPLLTAAKPRATAGVKAGLLGTTKRKDGKLQVTYRNHPLYFFVKDVRAGQTFGQGIDGFGGEWYVLSAKGVKIERHAASTPAPAATTPTTTTPDYPDDPTGGYGYGN